MLYPFVSTRIFSENRFALFGMRSSGFRRIKPGAPNSGLFYTRFAGSLMLV